MSCSACGWIEQSSLMQWSQRQFVEFHLTFELLAHYVGSNKLKSVFLFGCCCRRYAEHLSKWNIVAKNADPLFIDIATTYFHSTQDYVIVDAHHRIFSNFVEFYKDLNYILEAGQWVL